MIRVSVVLATATLLAGCTTVAVAPRDLAPLDLSLTRRCPDPVAVPGRDLTEREAVALWGTDRLALRDCGRRFAAAIKVYQDRDRRLAGE